VILSRFWLHLNDPAKERDGLRMFAETSLDLCEQSQKGYVFGCERLGLKERGLGFGETALGGEFLALKNEAPGRGCGGTLAG
jgi:hypothetical protein